MIQEKTVSKENFKLMGKPKQILRAWNSNSDACFVEF